MTEKLRKPWLFILTIGLGTLLNPLNSSMISVALTRLQHEFSLTFADATWLISIFYLASAAGQPVMGKLSDMFGPKKLFFRRPYYCSCNIHVGTIFTKLSLFIGMQGITGDRKFDFIS